VSEDSHNRGREFTLGLTVLAASARLTFWKK
jgi:hypothetical protein